MSSNISAACRRDRSHRLSNSWRIVALSPTSLWDRQMRSGFAVIVAAHCCAAKITIPREGETSNAKRQRMVGLRFRTATQAPSRVFVNLGVNSRQQALESTAMEARDEGTLIEEIGWGH